MLPVAIYDNVPVCLQMQEAQFGRPPTSVEIEFARTHAYSGLEKKTKKALHEMKAGNKEAGIVDEEESADTEVSSESGSSEGGTSSSDGSSSESSSATSSSTSGSESPDEEEKK